MRIFLSILFATLVAGCFPLGKNIDSERTIGKRTNEHQTETQEILKVVARYNFFVILGPDGPGEPHIDFTQYHLRKGMKTIKLSHIYALNDDYSILEPVLPVADSELWIAARLAEVTRDHGTITFLVFDDRKLLRKETVQNCIRTCTSGDSFNDLYNYGIELQKGNSIAIFHTTAGDKKFNVIKNSFE
jgi:hypothetical protein